MDLEPGRTRVHEHAETGKPLAAFKLHGIRETVGAAKPPSSRVVLPCTRHGWNGPALFWGMVGHKLPAIGSPHGKSRWAGSSRFSPEFSLFAAPEGWPKRWLRHACDSQGIPSVQSLPFRFRLFPSDLAAGSSRPKPLAAEPKDGIRYESEVGCRPSRRKGHSAQAGWNEDRQAQA